MVQFIDDHRDAYGVESICTVVPIAPSTYFWHKARHADPTRRSARVQRDDEWRREIQRVWDDNQQVYGPRKVWRQLRREGHRVARCTVGRLMRAMGLPPWGCPRPCAQSIMGDRPRRRTAVRIVRLTSSTVTSQWRRSGPIGGCRVWVSDFTLRRDVAACFVYVALSGGLAYSRIDVFARRTPVVVGWRVSTSHRPHGLRPRCA